MHQAVAKTIIEREQLRVGISVQTSDLDRTKQLRRVKTKYRDSGRKKVDNEQKPLPHLR